MHDQICTCLPRLYSDIRCLQSYSEAVDLSSRISACIVKRNFWLALKSNGLHLNPKKTGLMWIGTRQRLAIIEQKLIPKAYFLISPSSSLRCLGFSFDYTMSCSSHFFTLLFCSSLLLFS